MSRIIYCDASLKNGKSCNVYDPQKDVTFTIKFSKNDLTHNDLEYLAVISALKYCIANKIYDAVILTDSKLIIGHIYNQWKMKEKFRKYYNKIISVLDKYPNIRIKYVPRSEQLAHR